MSNVCDIPYPRKHDEKGCESPDNIIQPRSGTNSK